MQGYTIDMSFAASLRVQCVTLCHHASVAPALCLLARAGVSLTPPRVPPETPPMAPATLPFAPDLAGTLEIAQLDAAARRVAAVEPAILSLAVLDNPCAVPILQHCQVDIANLRADLTVAAPTPVPQPSFLAQHNPRAWLQRNLTALRGHAELTRPGLSAVSARALAHSVAWATANQQSAVTGAALLCAVCVDDFPFAPLLARYGASRHAVTQYYVDGPWASEWPPIPPGFARVFMFNDAITSLAFVCKVMHLVFGYSRSHALAFTMRVHRQGQGLCGAFPVAIAQAKAAKVRTQAEAASYPLQVRVELA